jgi:CheY-like chemotaxis protein
VEELPQASVLIIDDEPEPQHAIVNLLPPRLASCFKVRSPDDAIEEDLRRAHLVLVDYKLMHWETNAPPSELCKHVPNGLALVSILQQCAATSEHAVAFAIHSAHLPELTDPFKPQPRIHVLSRACNIDWAFEKSTEGGPLEQYSRILLLANAVKSLPLSWPRDDAHKTWAEVQRLLGIDANVPWADQTRLEIERCRPPLDELVQRVHGMLFVRWMLQRILSYPCFLLDENGLAARIAASPDSVRQSMGGPLASLLLEARYRGILAEFMGPRWWRVGVEYLLWKLGGNEITGTDLLRQILIEQHGIPLSKTDSLQPVVCLDTDFLPLNQLCDPSKAVRIQPDDWPGYAESAWITLELARSDMRMRGLVIASDSQRLEDESAGKV